MAKRLTVTLWKWKGHTMGRTRPDYTAKHVNIMAAMVRRNLTLPHEIVCVTDDAEGIDPSIRIVQIWPELRDRGRCFLRLKAFARGMDEVLGPRIVSLDLDTVIVGNLDPLFDRPEPFVIWSDPSKKTPYCGSMWMIRANAMPEVYENFDMTTHVTLKKRFGYFGSDQAWMSYAIPGAPTWGKADGVYSFRMHLLRISGVEPLGPKLDRHIESLGGIPLPENARIVHFHGIYDPSQKFLRRRVSWIQDHWRT